METWSITTVSMFIFRGSSFKPSLAAASKIVPPGTSSLIQVSKFTESVPVRPVSSTIGASANCTSREANSAVVIDVQFGLLNPIKRGPPAQPRARGAQDVQVLLKRMDEISAAPRRGVQVALGHYLG